MASSLFVPSYQTLFGTYNQFDDAITCDNLTIYVNETIAPSIDGDVFIIKNHAGSNIVVVNSTTATTTMNTLSVTNNETIGGTLGVTGATSLSTLSTSGLGTLNSFVCSNNALISGTLAVT